MDGLTIGVIVFAVIFVFGGIYISHRATVVTHKEIEEARKAEKK